MSEMDVLEKMLIDAGIEYDREDIDNDYAGYVYSFHQIRSKKSNGGKWKWDAICHKGSWGYEQGLLEVWGDYMNEPEGNLTAEEAFEKIKWILGQGVKNDTD